MSEIIPAPIPEIINKGRSWIAQTMSKAHKDTDYLSQATIYLPPSGGVTTRGPEETNPMTITTRPDTTTRLKVKLHGGFGFANNGEDGDFLGTTQRFNDVANSWQEERRADLTGFSLNGFGFTSCGNFTGITENLMILPIPGQQEQTHL
jgi:hypothetical protein